MTTSPDFTVRFTTSGRIQPIENWLRQNVRGKWTIKVDGAAEDLSKKNYVIIFEQEADRNAFRSYYRIPKLRTRRVQEPLRQRLTNTVSATFGRVKSKIKIPAVFQQSET